MKTKICVYNRSVVESCRYRCLDLSVLSVDVNINVNVNEERIKGGRSPPGDIISSVLASGHVSL